MRDLPVLKPPTAEERQISDGKVESRVPCCPEKKKEKGTVAKKQQSRVMWRRIRVWHMRGVNGCEALSHTDTHCASLCLSLSVSVCLCLYLSVSISLSLSLCLSLSLSVSLCLSLSLSVSLSLTHCASPSLSHIHTHCFSSFPAESQSTTIGFAISPSAMSRESATPRCHVLLSRIMFWPSCTKSVG